ncbi:MAG: DapH/DapD/GlmU-related protein [Bacteroidota bacterium]|nr:DapH/DapD/GlmU-related protein [Bacteroidota bacterium]
MLSKLYKMIFPASTTEQPNYNLVKGEDCIIDPSSIITTADKGEVILNGNNYIGRNVELGTTGKIEIGTNTSIQDRCIILGDVEIGKFCTFAPNVYISSGKHYYDHKPHLYIKDQDELVANDKTLAQAHSKKVTIGDDCWLGINSVIVAGLTIGRGCVIGANSVVTKDLEPFSVVGGAPAKLIKKRLAFEAKNSLKFDNENDLPNFYNGFFIDQKSLNENRSLDGIVASGNFTFYLKPGKKIVIMLKKIVSNTVTIVYNGKETKIENNDLVTLTFDSDANAYQHFLVKEATEKNTKYLVIKSVEVVN